MSKLNVDHKTIKALFEDKKSDFLIPDYQRPYAWTDEQCQTLWDDLLPSQYQIMITKNWMMTMTSIF
jgi:hypothetical protein